MCPRVKNCQIRCTTYYSLIIIFHVLIMLIIDPFFLSRANHSFHLCRAMAFHWVTSILVAHLAPVAFPKRETFSQRSIDSRKLNVSFFERKTTRLPSSFRKVLCKSKPHDPALGFRCVLSLFPRSDWRSPSERGWLWWRLYGWQSYGWQILIFYFHWRSVPVLRRWVLMKARFSRLSISECWDH